MLKAKSQPASILSKGKHWATSASHQPPKRQSSLCGAGARSEDLFLPELYDLRQFLQLLLHPLDKGNNSRTPDNLTRLQIWKHLSKIKPNKCYHYSELGHASASLDWAASGCQNVSEGRRLMLLISSFHIHFCHYLVAGSICKLPRPIKQVRDYKASGLVKSWLVESLFLLPVFLHKASLCL